MRGEVCDQRSSLHTLYSGFVYDSHLCLSFVSHYFCTLYRVLIFTADIVSCILAALEGGEVKRSRKHIINQLVRQELVEDRKLLHKKSVKKKKVQSPVVTANPGSTEVKVQSCFVI